MRALYMVTTLCVLHLSGYGQDADGNPPEEIVKYYFVELITNPARAELPKAEVDSIQRAHMANISKMIEAKKNGARRAFRSRRWDLHFERCQHGGSGSSGLERSCRKSRTFAYRNKTLVYRQRCLYFRNKLIRHEYP